MDGVLVLVPLAVIACGVLAIVLGGFHPAHIYSRRGGVGVLIVGVALLPIISFSLPSIGTRQPPTNAVQPQTGAGSINLPPTVAASDDHASEAGYPYPRSVEASFRTEFANSPGMGDCALAAMEKRYSYDDFVSVSHAYGGTGDLPPSIKAIIVTCALKLQ